MHGAGCRFVSGNGTEVDVDFAADGSEVFDFWRLRWYELSLSEPVDVTDEDLQAAVLMTGFRRIATPRRTARLHDPLDFESALG
ncbi:DUF6896 domain-containing protein [Streptomyces sp. NPDC005775]|uniref:DUF6896 domain-containing protein n=1 Tax=Streptomyces sp. NPDC005775 TaxID=3364729 RepID=UPI0036BD5258